MKPIILCGEAKGANEERIGAGFVGWSGIELLRMLNEASVIEFTAVDYDYINKFWQTGDHSLIDMVWRLHPEVYRTNVFQFHPPGDEILSLCGPKDEAIPGYPAFQKSKYIHASYAPELERLGDEILAIDPNLIVCLGNTALWALAGKTGISKLRGTTCTSTHTVSGYKLLGAYHPAAITRQWSLRSLTVADLMKAKHENQYPEVRRPKREIWIEPTLEDFQRFYGDHILGCQILSVDIETAGRFVTSISFAPRIDLSIVIPFTDARKPNRNYWPDAKAEGMAWALVRLILEDPEIKKLFQNGAYDIAFLWRAYGIRTFSAEHDTMLLHHALQPESLKSLGFLGSIYTDEGPWKHERKGTQTIKRDE